MKLLGLVLIVLCGTASIAAAQSSTSPSPAAPSCDARLAVVDYYRAAGARLYEKDMAVLLDENTKLKARVAELEKQVPPKQAPDAPTAPKKPETP